MIGDLEKYRYIKIKFFSVVNSYRLQQVDENRKSVTNEVKKSICNLIMEINRKGNILLAQLEVCHLHG